MWGQLDHRARPCARVHAHASGRLTVCDVGSCSESGPCREMVSCRDDRPRIGTRSEPVQNSSSFFLSAMLSSSCTSSLKSEGNNRSRIASATDPVAAFSGAACLRHTASCSPRVCFSADQNHLHTGESLV